MTGREIDVWELVLINGFVCLRRMDFFLFCSFHGCFWTLFFKEALQRCNGTPMCVLNRSEKVSTTIISCLKERLITHAVMFAFFNFNAAVFIAFLWLLKWSKTKFDCFWVCVRMAQLLKSLIYVFIVECTIFPQSFK